MSLEQIKFINQFVKLYGFTCIADYDSQINKVNDDDFLHKINKEMSEIKKLFKTSKLNLSRKQYKIDSVTLAFSLLRNLLQQANVPFETIHKSNGNYLRLIPLNKTLMNYIDHSMNNIIHGSEPERIIEINDFFKDVTDKLKIYRMRNNTTHTDLMKGLMTKCKDDFECVSTYQEVTIKPSHYKVYDDLISISHIIVRDCDMFRIKEVNIMSEDGFHMSEEIEKIELLSGGQTIVSDIETSRLIPYMTFRSELEIGAYFDKKLLEKLLNVNLSITFEKIHLSINLRKSLRDNNYKLFDNVKIEDGIIIKYPIKIQETPVNYIIYSGDRNSINFSIKRDIDAIYDIELETVDCNLNPIKNQIAGVSLQANNNVIYTKTRSDDFKLEEFDINNPIPLRYIHYMALEFNISTYSNDVIILIKYKRRLLPDIKEPFYISEDLLVKDGLINLSKIEELKDISHISKFLVSK